MLEAEITQSAGFRCEKAWETQKQVLPSSMELGQNTGWDKTSLPRTKELPNPSLLWPQTGGLSWTGRPAAPNTPCCCCCYSLHPVLSKISSGSSLSQWWHVNDCPTHCQLPLGARKAPKKLMCFPNGWIRKGNAAAVLLGVISPCSPRHRSHVCGCAVRWEAGEISWCLTRSSLTLLMIS